MEYLQYHFNIKRDLLLKSVLNLIINGIPSILIDGKEQNEFYDYRVLNLIINGIPSIL